MLVAAMTMMPSFCSKPSISVSSWLSVLRDCAPSGCLRAVPTASISSMKMMHGIFALGALKSCRTRLEPTPTNISSNSEPAR